MLEPSALALAVWASALFLPVVAAHSVERIASAGRSLPENPYPHNVGFVVVSVKLMGHIARTDHIHDEAFYLSYSKPLAYHRFIGSIWEVYEKILIESR